MRFSYYVYSLAEYYGKLVLADELAGTDELPSARFLADEYADNCRYGTAIVRFDGSVDIGEGFVRIEGIS